MRAQKLPDIPTWKAKHSKALLEDKARDPATFERGYRQRAVSPGELMFPSFETCFQSGVSAGELQRRTMPICVGVDLAGPRRKGNAIASVGVDTTNWRKNLVGIRYGKWTSPKTAENLAEVCGTHGDLRYVMVENNAYQDSLIDWIKKEKQDNVYWKKIESFTTGSNKGDPEFGLPGLEVEFKNKAWVFPYSEWESHPSTCACDWCHFEREVANYPAGGSYDGLMACVVPGALVTTARGLIPIEGVRIGDLVLTHRGRWRRVERLMAREYRGECVRIRPGGGLSFMVTPEHPVWSARAVFYREDRTNRLVPDEWRFEPAGHLRAGRKRDGDWAMFPVPREWPSDGDESWVRDEEDGFLAGLYLAEGCLAGDPHQVSFALHERGGYIVDFIREWAQARLGVKVGVQRRVPGRGIAAYFGSRRAAREMFATFGKGSTKAMPWSWMGLPVALRMAMVRGWLVGDGHLYGGKLCGVSISRDLIEQVVMTLRQDGISPAVSVFEDGGERLLRFKGWGKPSRIQRAWKVSLNQSDTARVLEKVNRVEAERWKGARREERDRTNQQALLQGDGFAVRLREAERVPFEGLVHNLHVEEDESYVVEGLAVHNCWFASSAIDRWVHRAGLGKKFRNLNVR